MSVVLAFIVLAVSPRAAGQSSTAISARQTATWDEEDGLGGAIVNRIAAERGGLMTQGFLKLEWSREQGDGIVLRTRTDKDTNDEWSEWKLAVPIAVRDDPRPQVLGKYYRPNWLDFKMYALTDAGIVLAFSFSCRDDAAVKWRTQNGELIGFETYDRYAHAPAELEMKHEIGHPWALRSWYAYDAKVGQWVEKKNRWVKVDFDKPLPGDEIEKPEDCRFMYKSKVSG